MRINIESLPWDVATFHVKLSNYLMQRAAHRLTKGVPAPFPEHEMLRTLAEQIELGDKIEVFDDAPANSKGEFPAMVTQEQLDAAISSRSLWTRIVDVFNP